MTASATGLRPSTDPFSLLEDALAFALESHPAVQAVAKIGNLTRFTDDEPGTQLKPGRLDADLPELGIVPQLSQSNQRNSSSAFGVVQRYSLEAQTSFLGTAGRAGKRSGVNQIKWACMRALAMYRGGIPGLPFVVRVALLDAPERIAVLDPERPSREGWTVVLAIECWLNWPWDEVDA